MSLVAIARKEVLDLGRSKTPWALAAVVTLVVAVPVLTQSGGASRTDLAPVERALTSVVTLGSLLLPLALLVASYDAVADEVDSGSVTYLLGLPNTRFAAVAGKLVGRTVVASLGVVAAFGVGGLLFVVQFGGLPVVTYLAILALTLYFAATWTAIGVGISALAGTRTRALACALGAYLTLVLGWILPLVLRPRAAAAYLVESLLGLGARPELYDFAFRLSPTTAYASAANGVLSGGETTPFFLRAGFMLPILLGWLVAPVALGYLRFRDAELAS
ncbi:ABC transporter permease subunit [Halorussus aquaticus]|uniref:ABC transporter permease subunit n=1 Tax=Halorussus aquaticus TaxID=2953748 RepID=A0ABD5Q6L4_9EURY|nr:ABC transporter permease subunit [Halorussus aquaticus]